MDIETLKPFIPYLIPVVIIEMALLIAALADLIPRKTTRGPKWVWFLVVLLVNFIGPIIYFVIGRKEE